MNRKQLNSKDLEILVDLIPSQDLEEVARVSGILKTFSPILKISLEEELKLKVTREKI